MKFHLFALIFLSVSTAAFAQESDTDGPVNPSASNEIIFEHPDRDKGGLFYLMLGNSSLNMDSLNQRLETAGYSKMNQNFTSIGIGGHALLDRLVIGGEFQGLIEKKVSTGSYRTAVSGGYALVNAGYVMYSKRTLRVYPQAGVGLGTISLNINDSSTPSFDQLLINPKRGTSATNSSILLNFALAADGLIAGEGSGSRRVFVFGFRAGYLWSVSSDGWRNSEGSIGGGPGIGFTGPYLQIVIGGGFLD